MRQSYHFEGCYSTNFNTILRNFWLHFKIFEEIDGFTRYKMKAGRGVLRQALTYGKYATKSRVHNPAREYVPLPHVFPPSAVRQSPTGRDTLTARTLSGVASLCHLSLWCKKKQSAPATAYKFWCLGFASSSPLLLAFRLRKSECFYKNSFTCLGRT